VIDGSRHAVPTVTDLAISGGVIADVGDLSRYPRTETIDGSDRVLAPGFIDTHTHVEMASLRGDADRFAPVAQGVTTALVGADGFGWVGIAERDRARWWEDTVSLYGQPLDPLPGWATPGEFLSDLRAASPTSVVPLVPHNNVRAAVIGDARGAAGPSDLAAMRGIIEAWMDAGAVGLATGLDYLPGRHADTDEITRLCDTVAARGGVYASHLRLHDLGRADAWREIGEIGRTAGIPIRIAHERLDDDAAALLEEVSVGNDVTFDTYLYSAGCTSLAFHVPPAQLEDGVVAFSRRLASDPALRAEIAALYQDRLTGQPGQEAIVAATASGRFEGMSMTEVAAARGSTIGEAAVELMRDELPCALLVYVWQAADAVWDATVARTLADERSIIASDGVYLGSSPHPRGFGTFPRVLGKLSRDDGLIPLSVAIHKMTGKPADAYGLADRGRIEPGLRADLVLFDPDSVAGPADFDAPRTTPTGIELVMVGGRRVSEENR
jgi:N-acyl-D-amino-acid deacylase